MFDRDGRLLSLSLSADEKYRLFTPLGTVSPAVIQAALLYEDKHFYIHPGVNPVSLLRGTVKTALSPAHPIGGSTITMQLARLMLHLHTRSIGGKARQILWALLLERHYSKRQILEAYLNLAPYGANVEGIGAASLVYFHKPASELLPGEAITLAVLPQHPAGRWQVSGREELEIARGELMRRFPRSAGGDQLAAKDLLYSPANVPARAPHLFNRLAEFRPKESRFVSSLDAALQTQAEEVLRSMLERYTEYGVKNGTVLIAELPALNVRAYVGSGGYLNRTISGFVNGLSAPRSPGSLLKPFIYGLALNQGQITPETMLSDVPLRLSAYTPENYERNFLGPISATDALIRSRNIPALEVFRRLEPSSLYQFLGAAGVDRLKAEDYYGIALVLGGLGTSAEEIAQLYGVLGNGGVFRPLEFLSGEEPRRPPKKLFSPEAAFLVLDMLSQNPPALGRFRSLKIPWKTGTSYGSHDAWAAGIIGRYVVVVWLGDFENKANPNLLGRDLAGPVFFSIADCLTSRGLYSAAAASGLLNLKKVEVCALSGALAGPDCPHRKLSWFIPGVSPIKRCAIHKKIEVEPATGLRLCPGEHGGEQRVYEFWDSEMQKLFAKAGVKRSDPPPYAERCGMPGAPEEALRIISPEEYVEYRLEPRRSLGPAPGTETDPELELEFLASVPADARQLYWFVDDTLIGQTIPSLPVHWAARIGEFSVRAVDDRGRSSVIKIHIVPQTGGA